MKLKYLLPIALLFSVFIDIQATDYYFYVQFKDKNNTPYSLSNPSVYLSQRALERRTFFNVAIDSTDLPVNPNYISQISSLNIPIHCRTKWLNGVTVALSDSSLMSAVRLLSFVKFTQFTGKTNELGSLLPPKKTPTETNNTDYGSAASQINQLNGAILHNSGYRGQGIQIAVIDVGFQNVNINPGFDSLRNEGRLLGTKDFVNPQSNIFTEGSHGAHVLSTMAGNIPNIFVGTAPKASYWLLRSEADNTENLCEPDFWVSAIEFADSVGVDLSTTSLGYTEFNIPSMNYTYADMNGKVARASIAATLAVDKGIMVLNSAGNDGYYTWHYIGVPADADKIITVGSVTNTGIASTFSSFGPSFDGRIKPELCATGTNSALISPYGSATYGSGTSYACPILAGMTACFLQAAKEKKPTLSLSSIKDLLFQSGSLYNNPTTQMGYGIPDFQTALSKLIGLATVKNQSDDAIAVYVNVNANKGRITVCINTEDVKAGQASLYSASGKLVNIKLFNNPDFSMDIRNLPKGVYMLRLNFDAGVITKKVMIL
ncbi:MAG: S8 family serine peptidase [Paludibacteraceae bacterium]